MTDPPAATLTMDAFVREIADLCARGFPREAVHRFLAGGRLEPSSLDAHLHFAPDRYTRHLVYRRPEVEVLVLCWPSGSRAPVHGHEGELCWARVERGRLRFTNWRELSREPLRLEPVQGPVEGGPGYLDGPADLHAVENPAERGQAAVSLHVYSKPYAECDLYDLERGVVRRVRLEYDSVAPAG